MGTSKLDLIQKIIDSLNLDLAVMRKAAIETHNNSTSEQSKQEGKYDTRGIEASYLAQAQAENIRLYEEGISKLEQISGDDMPDGAAISHGSMIILSTDSEDLSYIMLPAGGGLSISAEGLDFIVITPDSPIGSSLIGKHLGDTITHPKYGDAFISDLW